MQYDPTGNHGASAQGLMRPGSSNVSRGSQFVDIQSPLTYLSKEKRQGASKWNQPVLRQKYQRGQAPGSRTSHQKISLGSSHGRIPILSIDTATGSRTSRSKPEVVQNKSNTRTTWQRDPRQNASKKHSTPSVSKSKNVGREKPTWGARP